MTFMTQIFYDIWAMEQVSLLNASDRLLYLPIKFEKFIFFITPVTHIFTKIC